VCYGASVDDTEVIAASTSDATGLCHSGFPLLGTTCGNPNIAMVAVQDTSHPLWDTICTFLGCKPAINVTPIPSGGTVSSNKGGINCGNVCTGLVDSGTAVTLTATPAAGFTFNGWSGDCSGTNAQCILTILPIDTKPSGYQVTANFTQGLINAKCAVTTIEGPNNQPMNQISATFSGTVPAAAGYFINIGGITTPGANALSVAASLDGVNYADITPFVRVTPGPFNCGSWTDALYTVLIPGYGYFNTSCLDSNNPAINANWQWTISILYGGVVPFYRIVDAVYVLGGSPIAVTAMAYGIANCPVP
jgi:uncharacterized repeat protein (TIGR02543 family)